MCGITGIFGASKNLSNEVKNSLSKITHRGTELYEFKAFDSCAIGSNRLAIVDGLNGKQPLVNEDDTVFAVQNGEVFNYLKLQEELEKKGHKFKTNCDTEVLVHLWEEYGTKMVEKIDSEMFAFIIYDKKNDSYFIARDPIGVKPIYYAFDDKKRLFIASEIKQLTQFKQIKEILEFPPGHYCHNGRLHAYFKLPTKTKAVEKNKTIKELQKILEESVKKRVQTDLPIGVFLSGGVDSSLVMELANRYHKNVTAIILGTKNSGDLTNAVRICREKKWKHVTITPHEKFAENAEKIVYYAESYEPNIVRHSFANDLVSQTAAKIGLKIVLVGEGIDELFAGYNEFLELPEDKINLGCSTLLESMSKGNLMRVDKMAMKSTIEIRSPFFDTALIEYAQSIPGKYKVERKEGKLTTKAIFREAASKYLPKYIAYRTKAAFANGAGMNVGTNYLKKDGVMKSIAAKKISDKQLLEYKKKYPKYKFSTKEEIYYFKYYQKFGYTKFKDGEKRLIVKDNLKTI